MISLTKAVDNILQNPLELSIIFDGLLDSLYNKLAETYYDKSLNYLEDENSDQYKLLNLFEEIADDDIEKAKALFTLLYISKNNIFDVSDLLDFLNQTEYSISNLLLWMELNGYVEYGECAYEFYNYINGYSYNGSTVVQYIKNTLLLDSRFIQSGISDLMLSKYKVHPKSVKISNKINLNGFRNYREVMEAYDAAVSTITDKTFNVSASNTINKEISELLDQLFLTGPGSERPFLLKEQGTTIVYFLDKELDNRIKYLLLDRFYITVLTDDIVNFLNTFISYMLMNLDKFDLTYDTIDFANLGTYLKKYFDINYEILSLDNLKNTTLALLIYEALFKTESEASLISTFSGLYSKLGEFKTFISNTINTIITKNNKFEIIL